MARPKPSRRNLPPEPEMSPEKVAAMRAELESRLNLIRQAVLMKRLRPADGFDPEDPDLEAPTA